MPMRTHAVPIDKTKCRRAMRLRVRELDPIMDGPTELAEYAACVCDCNQVGGPLDDETHWIWEMALREWEAYHGRIV